MIDYYSPAAEFFDLVGHRHVASSGPAVRAALAGLDTSHGPVVDIGAGTGLVTEVVADALPDVEIIAAEPSPNMRAILTSRVFANPALRQQVTVTADSAQELRLPDRISAALIFGVAGHLTLAERKDLWQRLADRLPTGGIVVVELMGVDTPRHIPFTRMVRETMGRQTYEWWISGEPAGDAVMRWHTAWRVYQEGQLVREVEDSYEWATFGVAELARESGMASRQITHAGGGVTPEIGVLVK
ncbi:class I SAM-dependent methyltransferase [Streptomyces sp. NPDC054933]